MTVRLDMTSGSTGGDELRRRAAPASATMRAEGGGAMPGIDIDIARFAELGDDLLPELARLQRADPLFWSEASHCWIATGHDLVAEGFSGRLPLSARRHEIIASFFPESEERERKIGYLLHIFSKFLVNMDPPEQSRLRRLLMGAFSRGVAESFRPYARQVVFEAMERIEGRPQIDFVSQVARPVTARIILRMIGLSEDYLPRLELWAQRINAGLSGSPDRDAISAANDVLEEMRDVFEAEIAQRKESGDGDFLSLLLAARDGPDRLTRDEVIAQLMLVLIAGHDTTLNTMTLAVGRLASLPAERSFMRANPQCFDACIMELMRVVSMSTAMARIVADDFEWAGRRLRKGEFVFLMIAGANRDPAMFEDPERIDFDRPQQGNMTFAPGRHFCIGHWLAKMMMSELLPQFLERFEGWRVLEDRLPFTGSIGFRGPTRLRLRLEPRASTAAPSRE